MNIKDLRTGFIFIFSEYVNARATGSFGKKHPIWATFTDIQKILEKSDYIKQSQYIKVSWSVGQGNWAKIPWIGILDSRETDSIQKGVYCVILFRQDMSGVYLCMMQGVTEPKNRLGITEARNHLSSQAETIRKKFSELEEYGFQLDSKIDLRSDSGLGVDYEYSTIAYKFYEANAVPADSDIVNDLNVLLETYDNYIKSKDENLPVQKRNDFVDHTTAVNLLIKAIAASGFYFEPWQVAAYITALRTKPFVILAGVSGTGKSKLPALVARITGGEAKLLPVRPDWTDSSDVLGYCDLQGSFRPGPLLELAREASRQRDKHFICILDEMNLARVEQYFAEVLSRIEDRQSSGGGGYKSGPLISISLSEQDAVWRGQGLPPNLAIVGTVNMDESTHGFSRKVLDRAFTIELSDIDLSVWEKVVNGAAEVVPWPVRSWYPRAAHLGALEDLSAESKKIVQEVIQALIEINAFLTQAQIQVGYRVRDEIVLFVLHAREISSAFVTRSGEVVNPLDLAFQMKVLPRIAGGSNAIRQVLLQFLGWAYHGQGFRTEEEATAVNESWESTGRPGSLAGARFPRTAARLCLMWDRLLNEGFTSFWL